VELPSRARLSYEQVFHQQFQRLAAFARLLGTDDPEDVAQEALVRLHAHLSSLRDDSAAVPYLRTTVINLVRARHRHAVVVDRASRLLRVRLDTDAQLDPLSSVWERKPIENALASLNQRHREAIVLRYWLDMSERDMATVMGVTVGTVKSHLSRATATLRGLLDQSGDLK